MRHFIALIFIMFTFNSIAVTYSQVDIDELVNDSKNQQLIKEFVRGFFTAKDPVDYIENYLLISKNNSKPVLLEPNLLEPILLDYGLYQLLGEVSYQAKQDFLQEFVNQMKVYQTTAFKMHDEGRVPVEVYNINAKAIGIENIWLASDSYAHYQRAFGKDSIATLLDLKSSLSKLKQPEWLGLKKSIKTFSQGNHDLITGYLLEDAENLNGLDKFVSRYALFTANQELVQSVLQNLDKSNSEYLLRHLKAHFDQSFAVQQLIAVVASNKNTEFAISMMAEFINEKEIEEKLFSLLVEEKHSEYSKQAALVLIKLENTRSILNMEALFVESDSEQVKKQIIFVLKMNQLPSARVVLERISVALRKDSQTNKWLAGFTGEFK